MSVANINHVIIENTKNKLEVSKLRLEIIT